MITDYVLVQLNGKAFNCLPGFSLKDLILYLNLEMSSLIVEYNQEVISYFDYESITVKSGDKIELVTIVGGG